MPGLKKEFGAVARTACACLAAAGIAWVSFGSFASLASNSPNNSPHDSLHGNPEGNPHGSANDTEAQPNDGQLWQTLKRRWWQELPDTPSAPTVEPASPESLLVTWEAPDSTTDITAYHVEFRVHDASGSTVREPAGSETGTTTTTDTTDTIITIDTTVTIDGLMPSTLYHVRVRAVNDAGPGDWSAPGTAMTENAAPVFLEGDATTRTLPENSPGAYEIGAPVAASDADGDTLTYALGGADAQAFAIDAATGQLATRPDYSYDHEANPSHALAVTAADGHGNQAEIALTVHVTNVLEPPLQPDPPTVAPTGIDALTVSWTAPPNTGRPDITGYNLRYRGPLGPFTLWHETPTRTRTQITGLQEDRYEVQVRGVNDEGDGTWSASGHGTVVGKQPPNLVVNTVRVDDASLNPGETFTLSATVANAGEGDSPATTLRYYRSTNDTISPSDTQVAADTVSALSASGTSVESISLSAPTRPGTYHYGACVDAVADESDTSDNCSSSVRVDVATPNRPPNLVVNTFRVNDASLNPGQTLTLSATVTNAGAGDSPATTLRYYRSTDATISRSDAQVGTDTVSALSASGTSVESISLSAPTQPGTYHYGACVDAVADESNTLDNCSSSARVIVVGSRAPDPGFDIDIVFVDPQPSAAIKGAVNAAAAVWERAITNDLADIDFSGNPWDDLCTDGAFAGLVDDLRVYVYVVDIDGPGGVTASAGYCVARRRTGTPVIGLIRFDSNDVGRLSTTFVKHLAVHELAHVLGFGPRWNLQNRSIRGGQRVNPPPDTHWPGANAVAAFNAAGGANYQGGKVPVENAQGGRGSQDKHWRLSVMPGELMTYNIDGTALSAITIGAMADLGYKVNTSVADSYKISSTTRRPPHLTAAREFPLRCEIDQLPVEYVPEASEASP